MKTTKKLFALVLALVMVLALSVTAFATDTTGSITIDNAVAEKTYTIYRIFDLDSHNTDYTAFNYKVNAKWADFFKTGAAGFEYVEIDQMGYVTWKNGADAPAFAAAAIQFAEANKIAYDGQMKATSATVIFERLPLGYYLVQSDLGVLCSLDTTLPNVTIEEKNSAPSIDKKVQEDSNDTWDKANDADLNQVVNFMTTINVLDGKPVNYILHDKMSAGLTFRTEDATNLTVKIGDRTLNRGTDYTLVTEGLTDGCTFEVHFIDGKLKPNDVVTVSYSALVNENAVIGGTGNSNETRLNYGNDNKTTLGSTTRTYVWGGIEAFKYTMKGETETPLEDAKFVLYKMVGEKKFYAVVNMNNNKITGWTENAHDSKESTKASVFTTPKDGKFSIIGLDADTYYLEEIKAPAGYNALAAPIEVVITAVIDEVTHVGTATVTYNGSSTGEVKIENKTGAELPSTGGIGTTIFYVVGGILVLGAAILLITRKRMSKADD